MGKFQAISWLFGYAVSKTRRATCGGIYPLKEYPPRLSYHVERVMASFEIGSGPTGRGLVGPAPVRLPSGELAFSDFPAFRPNLTPEQVLRAGAFGGGYFRNIHSAVTGESYRDAWRELPPEWIDGLDLSTMVASCTYRTEVNRYDVDCGGKADKSDTFGLRAWESAGWMHPQDPCVASCSIRKVIQSLPCRYGWFQWQVLFIVKVSGHNMRRYCRFFVGRRSDDDHRQIKRWLSCAGPKGRWRSNLIGKCLRDGKSFNDETAAPVVRQTLMHWAYTLTQIDFERGAERVKSRGATYVPRSQLAHVMRADAPNNTSPSVVTLPRSTADDTLAGESAIRQKRESRKRSRTS